MIQVNEEMRHTVRYREEKRERVEKQKQETPSLTRNG